MITTPRLFRDLALVGTLCFACSTAALAQKPGIASEAKARFNQEMAVCRSGKSNQDLATCRIEAQNAYAEAVRGNLNDDPGAYAQNILKRCDSFKGEERTDCEGRMGSTSQMEGSAAGGGILRKNVTAVPAN
jgi:hypothetical protein